MWIALTGHALRVRRLGRRRGSLIIGVLVGLLPLFGGPSPTFRFTGVAMATFASLAMAGVLLAIDRAMSAVGPRLSIAV